MKPYHRHSIRLRGYDYSQRGYCFVTVCTHKKEELFGCVKHNRVFLSEFGLVVKKCWLEIPIHFNQVGLDEWIIMPNHIHGVLMLTDGRGEACLAPTLGMIIGSFKSACTKHVHRRVDNPQLPIWQRNYYEHIIRNEKDYWAIKQYIQDNPRNWEKDELFISPSGDEDGPEKRVRE